MTYRILPTALLSLLLIGAGCGGRSPDDGAPSPAPPSVPEAPPAAAPEPSAPRPVTPSAPPREDRGASAPSTGSVDIASTAFPSEIPADFPDDIPLPSPRTLVSVQISRDRTGRIVQAVIDLRVPGTAEVIRDTLHSALRAKGWAVWRRFKDIGYTQGVKPYNATHERFVAFYAYLHPGTSESQVVVEYNTLQELGTTRTE